jgi:hypothetical protein
LHADRVTAQPWREPLQLKRTRTADSRRTQV